MKIKNNNNNFGEHKSSLSLTLATVCLPQPCCLGENKKVIGFLSWDCERKSSFFMEHKAAICDNSALFLLAKFNECQLCTLPVEPILRYEL